MKLVLSCVYTLLYSSFAFAATQGGLEDESTYSKDITFAECKIVHAHMPELAFRASVLAQSLIVRTKKPQMSEEEKKLYYKDVRTFAEIVVAITIGQMGLSHCKDTFPGFSN